MDSKREKYRPIPRLTEAQWAKRILARVKGEQLQCKIASLVWWDARLSFNGGPLCQMMARMRIAGSERYWGPPIEKALLAIGYPPHKAHRRSRGEKVDRKWMRKSWVYRESLVVSQSNTDCDTEDSYARNHCAT